jgi:hypothetical protein
VVLAAATLVLDTTIWLIFITVPDAAALGRRTTAVVPDGVK